MGKRLNQNAGVGKNDPTVKLGEGKSPMKWLIDASHGDRGGPLNDQPAGVGVFILFMLSIMVLPGN